MPPPGCMPPPGLPTPAPTLTVLAPWIATRLPVRLESGVVGVSATPLMRIVPEPLPPMALAPMRMLSAKLK